MKKIYLSLVIVTIAFGSAALRIKKWYENSVPLFNVDDCFLIPVQQEICVGRVVSNSFEDKSSIISIKCNDFYDWNVIRYIDLRYLNFKKVKCDAPID